MGYHDLSSYIDMVERLAKGHFGDNEVTRVEVVAGDEWQGAATMDITVSLGFSMSGFDVEKAAGFKDDLRSELDRKNDSPIPVVSFLTIRDQKVAA